MRDEIAPADLAARLEGATPPVAVIDVAEEAAYSREHLLHASNMPLDRLESMVATRVPLRGCTVVVCDADGRSEAPEAVQRLRAWGYGEVALLKGGRQGWKQAGLPLYGGMNTRSKAFGEAVEVCMHTPKMSVDALHELRLRKAPHVLIDCRPTEEYLKQSLPDSINLPGAELAYRIAQVVSDPDIPVIVHCAGRTRSIMGAQTLIESGIRNPVCSLENGTMGWVLAGHEAAPGLVVAETNSGAPPAAAVRQYAQAVAHAQTIGRLDERTAQLWMHGPDEPPTYLVDVRTPGEYEAGHLAGAMHAPGGQLVQATDKYLVVQNARVILVDDDGVRASITGGWLRRMGWPHVHVLAMETCGAPRVQGAEPKSYFIDPKARTRWIHARELDALLNRHAAQVLDLDTSLEYEAGHIRGAAFIKRRSLASRMPALDAGRIVLTSSDGIAARIAASELAHARPVWVLEGGKAAARAAGLPFAAGPEKLLDPADDLWRRPLDAPGDRTAHMKNYLSWEVGLMEQIDRDRTVRFAL